jgi:hypothetical protein
MLVCALVLLHLPARGAILLHEYALRGTLDDNLGGNSLGALGGEITALGYVFAADQGINFSSRTFTPKDYSIELSFSLSTPAGTTKIVDFHNVTAEPGLYQRDGRLEFTPEVVSGISDFTPGINTHVVLTRDGATNIVTAYVNGQERFSFLDDLSLAAPPGFSNKMSFFVDDGNEPNASGGTFNYLRVFSGALGANDVSALFAGGPPTLVPEPSTFVLIMIGATSFVMLRRRHSRGS